MNKSNCCEKCTYHAGIAPEKRESQLHGTEFCGDVSCECHQKATTYEIEELDEIHQKAHDLFWKECDELEGYSEIVRHVVDLTLTHQQERIIAALEGELQKLLPVDNSEEGMGDWVNLEIVVYNQALTDAIEVVKKHEKN